ncbi:MAG TPA: type I restriction enzyme endonuclease domain-containing protein, partial [Acidimicrobiales bacterium]|nr:type I restriction enzyme endonuclease domain-containing protein [Acidimicrobiales bacterium]
AERFRRLIDEYNAGTHNLEEFLRRLKAINDELTEEEQRTVREDLSEEELAVYDLLTKPTPELTEAERAEVKATAKRLLAHVTEKLVLDWRKRQHTRAAVQVAVGKILDADLPEVYGPELFDDKVRLVYEHIYASYFDNGQSVYTGAAEPPPAVVPVATVRKPEAVDDQLLDQARNDPALFARLMEELYGTRETWFRTTEDLLADDETRSVEFKQTARWNVNEQKKDKVMEEVIVKTVAGFLNGQGGTLLIGVTDSREPVGLDDDYALVKPPNADGYVGWLDTLLEASLGHAGAHRVQIRVEVVGGRDVCRLDVPASSRPIWAKGKAGDVLYERRNNSTRVVPAGEIDVFLAERFGMAGSASAGYGR